MTDSNALRSDLNLALALNRDRLCQVLQTDLARPTPLDGPYRRLEIDPCFYGIASCTTEEFLLPDNWLDTAIGDEWFDRAELLEGGWDEMIAEELCHWVADCWNEVGGPALFSPAYLFFHGFHTRQYDMEKRQWFSARDIFDE